MNKLRITRIFQILFGCILLVLGLNNFLNFLPLPEKLGFAEIFLETLHQAGYLFPTIAIIQLFAGIALLWNRWVVIGLLLLLPISFNIFFFHLLHDRGSFIPAVVILGLNLFFLFQNWKIIKSIFLEKKNIYEL